MKMHGVKRKGNGRGSKHLNALQMTIEKEEGKGRDPTSPKHGKEDPDNVPHVGGNTWAGGTGKVYL